MTMHRTTAYLPIGRVTSLVFMAFMSFFWLSTANFVHAENLVADGNMNAPDLAEWRWYGPQNLYQKVQNNGVGGDDLAMYLRSVESPSGAGGFQKWQAQGTPINVLPGMTYVFSFDYNIAQGQLIPRLGIANSNVDFENTVVRLETTNGDWAHYERTFTVPNNFVGDLRMVMQSSRVDAFVDNITIEAFIPNEAPSITLDTAAIDVTSTSVRIPYTAIDAESDLLNFLPTDTSGIEYSINNVDWFSATEAVDNESAGRENIASAPAPGVQHVFVWNAFFDLNELNANTVFVRLRPSDGEDVAIEWTTSDAFAVVWPVVEEHEDENNGGEEENENPNPPQQQHQGSSSTPAPTLPRVSHNPNDVTANIAVQHMREEPNGDRVYTLALHVPGAVDMAVSFTGDFTGVKFVPFQSMIEVPVAYPSGEKIISIRFRSESGNIEVVPFVIPEYRVGTKTVPVETGGFVLPPDEKEMRIVPKTTPCVVPPGFVYEDDATHTYVFVTKACTKQVFASHDVFASYGDAYGTPYMTNSEVLKKIKLDTTPTIAWGPKHAIKDGSLVKTPHDAKVYLVVSGKAYWIASEAVMAALGYDFANVIDVSDEVLKTFEMGAKIG